MNKCPVSSFLQCLLIPCLSLLPVVQSHAAAQQTISFETNEGSWISLDVAPDGSSLVFELLGDIYQLPLHGGAAEPIITGRGFASQPRFSPDGKQLVFVSDRSGEDNLWLADADGSNLRQLSAHTDGELISPSWSRYGQTIYVSRLAGRRSMVAGVELWAYPAAGGEPEKIPTPDMGRAALLVSAFPPGAYGPQPSTEGRSLYFTAAAPRQHDSNSGPSAALMKVDITSGRVNSVSYRSEPSFKPQLSRDGRWLAYGALRSGKTGLRLRNLETGDERWLVQDIGFNALESWSSRDLLPNFAFTPSGDALVIAYDGKIRQVTIADAGLSVIPFSAKVQMSVESRVETSVKIAEGPVEARLAKGAVISPDGKQFAFSAFGRLYRLAMDDQTPRQLTGSAVFGEFHPAWSPDGNRLVYVSWSAQEGGAIWKVPADGSQSPEKLTTGKAYYRNPVWSPDGRTIFAVSAPKLARLENSRGPMAKSENIVKLASSGGKPQVVAPAEGGVRVHFTRDAGRFYVYSPRAGLISMTLDGTDRKTHLSVIGAAGSAGSSAIANDILLNPNGDQALASVAGQLYIINMPAVPGDQPVVNVYAPGDTYTKVTSLGADHFSWADSEILAWSAGASLYRKAVAGGTISEVQAVVQAPRAKPSGTIALRGARIITMQGDKVIRNGDILIRSNRIQAVGKHGKVNIPKQATVINLRGKTIMPGIVDIHAHWHTKRPVLDLEDYNAYANLAYGVTAIRDPQSMTDDIFVYSDMVATGEMVGPRIFSTGRGVFFFNNFRSYEQVYAVLERYKKKYRTHLIKSYLPGSRQVRRWVIRACRELGLIVTAEGGGDAKMDITFALDGFSGTEHNIPLIPVYKDIIELYGQSGITYTPTLLVSFGGPFAANHFIANGDGMNDQKLHRFLPAGVIHQRTRNVEWITSDRHIFPQVARGAKQILDAGVDKSDSADMVKCRACRFTGRCGHWLPAA